MRPTVVALAISLALAAPASAMSADGAATQLSTEIMSPFCPGVTLHECPSAEALRLRDRIESWFRGGMSRGQILARLESEYGAGIRAIPATSGMGLAAWLVVGAGVTTALVLGMALVRTWSRRTNPSRPGVEVQGSDRRRLEDELAGLRARQ